MNKRGLFARTAAGAFGGMLLIGVAGAAIADEVGNDQVDVNVNIEAVEPVGALTMSVANDSTSLTEVTGLGESASGRAIREPVTTIASPSSATDSSTGASCAKAGAAASASPRTKGAAPIRRPPTAVNLFKTRLPSWILRGWIVSEGVACTSHGLISTTPRSHR